MLPTSGYFQNVVCPFFKSGYCERPHCHFKHTKTGTAGKSQWVASEDNDVIFESSSKPDVLLNHVGGSALGTGEVPNPYLQSTKQNLGIKTTGILKVPNSKPDRASAVPEYRPTPISQLKHNSEYKPESISFNENLGGRKRKKFEEYDPEEVKYSRKRVSFNLPGDSSVDADSDVITIESSEDELEADISATFGDDDDIVADVPPARDTAAVAITAAPTPATVAPSSSPPKEEINEFSLVDRILNDVSKNEELLKNFNRPPKTSQVTSLSKLKENVDFPRSSAASKTASNVSQSSSTVEKIVEPNLSKDDSCDLKKTGVGENEPGLSKDDQKKTALKTVRVKEEVVSDEEIDERSVKSKVDQKTTDLKTKVKTEVLTDEEIVQRFIKSKATFGESQGTDSDEKSAKEEKMKHPGEAEDKKKQKSEISKSGKSEKVKVDEKKSSKDQTVKKPKEDKSKITKPKSGTEEKSTKDKEKQKDSKEVKTKDKKDDRKKSVKKDGIKSLSKSDQSHSHKSIKSSSDEKSKNKTKESGDSKLKGHKSDQEKVKSSREKHSHDHENKDHSIKSKSSDSKVSHTHKSSSSSKTTHSSSKSSDSSSKTSHNSSKSSHSSSSKSSHSNSVKSSHSTSLKSSHNGTKSSSKSKETKKIQDECVSSSSIVKRSTQDQDLSKDTRTVVEVSDEESDDGDPNYDGGVSDVDDVDLDSSGSELDSDTLEECRRIFYEEGTSNAEMSKPMEESPPSSKEYTMELIPLGKKRQAHQVDFKRDAKPPRLGEKPRLNPAQVMHDRYLKLQEMYGKQNEQQDTSSFLSSVNRSVDSSKRRIAAVPSSGLIAAVSQKNKITLASTGNPSDPSEKYRIITKERVAHVPTAALSPRPVIPAAYGSKVPTNIRQKYLNNFIDECLKFCLSEDQAYEMALEEEKKAYDRSTSKTIYLNLAANALNRLRHRAKEGPPMEIPGETAVRPTVSSTTGLASECNRTVSHEMMLAGPRAQKVTYSIERRKKTSAPEAIIKGMLLYNSLNDYILTEEQLVENGFPLPHPTEAGRAVIGGIYAHKQFTSNHPTKRVCSRCKKTYYVDKFGNYAKEEECDYHWGRIYKRRIAGSWESRFMCCQGDAESDGCCVGPGHVFDGSDDHLLKGFVQTLPKSAPEDKYYGVYSLDCEMCYTTAGIELTRVTVIGPDMNAVFETYVKPEHPVLDYNTRFSGITEEDLIGITTTIRDVQAILLCMFNDKTILIGHSLESDFKALKLIHKTVVDTSVVFPHKLGPPFKRALRTLLAEKCNKIIQNDVGGHDSHEDAAACMELMLYKIKEDLKSSAR